MRHLFAANMDRAVRTTMEAIAEWESKTCLRFVKRTTETEFLWFHRGNGYDGFYQVLRASYPLILMVYLGFCSMKRLWILLLLPFNLLTPKSDYHLISPHNTTLESLFKVIRKNGVYHQLQKARDCQTVSPLSTLGNAWRTVWRLYIPMLRY